MKFENITADRIKALINPRFVKRLEALGVFSKFTEAVNNHCSQRKINPEILMDSLGRGDWITFMSGSFVWNRSKTCQTEDESFNFWCKVMNKGPHIVIGFHEPPTPQ